MSPLTDLQVEKTYDPLISPQVFCMKSGRPEEEQCWRSTVCLTVSEQYRMFNGVEK